jgi:hypothetical protein
MVTKHLPITRRCFTKLKGPSTIYSHANLAFLMPEKAYHTCGPPLIFRPTTPLGYPEQKIFREPEKVFGLQRD